MRVSNVTVRRRLVTVLLIGFFIFFIIDIRLGYVQFFIGDKLTSLAKESWSRNVPFQPKRGEILDRNGVEHATNKSAPTVFAVPRQIENPAQVAKKIVTILDMSEEQAYQYLTQKDFMVKFNKGGRKITEEQVKEIQDLDIEGIYVAEDFKRYYPFGDYLSHVLGFTGIDNQGLNGLELTYQEQLQGKKGYVQIYSDAKGQKMKNEADDYVPPQDGLDLMLTVDSKVQSIIKRELDIAETQYNPDGAIAIAMDPNTGEILGMSSRPSYNPENYQEVDADVYNRNLPIWSQYEPGSTFKIITLAAAIEENKVDLKNDQFYDPGHIEVAGAKLRCWKKGGHGSQTFLEVVQNSCNPGFVELGQRLGKDLLFDYIHEFGFGEKTGIDLQGEGKGILFKEEKVGPIELATTAFGQGVSVTPIQQVAAVSAAINGGTLYTPFVAKKWINPITGEVIMENEPKEKRQVISEETSKELRGALESVVAKGTGGKAFVDGYRVGGKTGTAQKAQDGRYLENNHIVSFIGFAPADDPEIVVYVAIDNPKGTVQFGGVVAAPIVGNIIEDSLRALEVAPRENQIEKEYKWNEEKMVEVPNLIGLTKRELQNQLINFSLKTSGEGDRVVQQLPEAGSKVKDGSTIKVFLSD
ncbi:stage V sporulation protein D [Bacillus carboniphilus]|uniref:serine-type D-Ala-D-Ala carboxypeptidase n=1 Tax=Bacillus carboniphilus TaxID=86663 RepID=A0ABY9JW46_9BACI|nr:stage V sporulation protein D [Bacillus carboniphilus]WLR43626.1 stage V sporulation protein D [Bacillus carboniphilus]